MCAKSQRRMFYATKKAKSKENQFMSTSHNPTQDVADEMQYWGLNENRHIAGRVQLNPGSNIGNQGGSNATKN